MKAEKLTAVICQLNSKYIHSSLASWYLYAGVKAYCNNNVVPIVADGTINESIDVIADRIVLYSPDAIGLCCYIWNITTVKKLIPMLKQRLPKTKIILGGPEVSYCAEHILSDDPLVDYVISGEGEKPFAALLNCMASGDEVNNISGLCYKNNDKIIISPPNTENDDPVNPYCPEYFEALNGRIAYLETSRGCPFSCAFCLSGRCGTVRFFDLDRAKSDMLRLANSGSKTIKLVDRTFNANRKRAYELFLFIKQNYGNAIPDDVCFHFEIAGDIIDDNTLTLLQRMPKGAVQLEIGLQSFNEDTLCKINRKTDLSALKHNISQLLKNNNIHIHIDLIAGLPLEDLDSFAYSFNEAFYLKSHMLQLGFLKLLRGAPMREQTDKFPCSFDNTPPYEVIETPHISANELALLHKIEDVFDRVYNSGRFRHALDYLLDTLSLSPFELFLDLANHINPNDRSLDSLIKTVYEYLCSFDEIDSSTLRDCLVMDVLCTNQSGRLPNILRVEDVRLKKLRLYLKENISTAHKTGVKRAVALLYSKSCGMYVDYDKKDRVTGEYEIKFVALPKWI